MAKLPEEKGFLNGYAVEEQSDTLYIFSLNTAIQLQEEPVDKWFPVSEDVHQLSGYRFMEVTSTDGRLEYEVWRRRGMYYYSIRDLETNERCMINRAI